MSINFYYMQGCHYCDKAKDMLIKEINTGDIIVKSSKEAPENVTGFPFFVNTLTGKSQAGLPSSKDELYKTLDIKDVSENNCNCKQVQPKNDLQDYCFIVMKTVIMLSIIFLLFFGVMYLLGYKK
jgi:hypothetical protein